jgi:hypothetical protein
MALDLTTAEETITVLLADDDTLPFSVLTAAGAAADITGATLTFRILPHQYSADVAALVTVNHAAMTITPATGIGSVPLTIANKTVLAVGNYYYRLHMVESNGTDTTIMRGPFVVSG